MAAGQSEMISLLRFLVALAIGAVAGLAVLLLAFFLIGTYASCPPQVHTCDLPMMAGFGLGMIAGPIVGLFATWSSFRWLGRALGGAQSRAT